MDRVSLDILNSDGERIDPMTFERLLGTNIKRYLTWGLHLKYGEKAVIDSCKAKIRSLKLVLLYIQTKTS